MKKIKNALAFFLLSFITIGLFNVKTSAAGYQSIFTDTINEAWYYEEILFLTRHRIVNGYPDGSFHPDADITVAEFTKLVVLALERDMSEPLSPPKHEQYASHWAAEYIDKALFLGILDPTVTEDESFSPDNPIKRIDTVRMIIRALETELVSLPENPFADTDDIYANTAYHEYLLNGYSGNDGKRLCKGEETTSRAEACSFVVRAISYMNNPTLFRTNRILSNAGKQKLNTEFELIDFFTAINKNMITHTTFRSDLAISTIAEYYRRANAMFPQYFYGSYINFYYSAYYDYYIVNLEYTKSDEEIFIFKNDADLMVNSIVEEMITPEMTEREKLRAIHDYIILNCAYDYENYLASTIPEESYLAYGALIKHVAVCQGYSAAFNLLCRKVGIPSLTLSGRTPGYDYDNHAWNMVLLDGAIYFIDVTSDDPVPDEEGRVNHTYFLQTPEAFRELGFSWDERNVQTYYFGLLRKE